MSITKPTLVVGASLAGAKVAETQRTEGHQSHSILLGEEQTRPDERPPPSTGYRRTDADRAYLQGRDSCARHDIEPSNRTRIAAVRPAGGAVVGMVTTASVVRRADGRTVLSGVIMAAVAALGLAACGQDEDSESSPSGPPSGAAAISEDPIIVNIKDFTYSPVPLSVREGVAVTVENDDEAAHTLTADDGSMDSGRIGAGDSVEVRPTHPGRIEYHCEIHPSMTGVIEVGAAADAEPKQPDPAPAPGY